MPTLHRFLTAVLVSVLVLGAGTVVTDRAFDRSSGSSAAASDTAVASGTAGAGTRAGADAPVVPVDPPEPGPGTGQAIIIKTFLFRPEPLTVPHGTRIIVENRDEIRHTVTSGTRQQPDGRFDHDLDGAGTRAELTFEQPGTYAYFCSLHPGMDATVEVT